MPTKKIKIEYEHGSADDNRLDLYDGSSSLMHLSRLFILCAHAYRNESVTTHATGSSGFKSYLLVPRRGSFIQEVLIDFLGNISAQMFGAYVMYMVNESLGNRDEDNEPSARLRKKIEPTFDLPYIIENPVREAHKPIEDDKNMSISAYCDRNRIFSLDQKTLELTRIINDPEVIYVAGNVTRFNAISMWGKVFDKEKEVIIPFLLDRNLNDKQKSLITWSLSQTTIGLSGDIQLRVTTVKSPLGVIKRYNITDVSLHRIE